MEELQQEPEYSFDFSKMQTTTDIQSLHQEGNFLIGMTSLGTTFRQRIPVDKMLNKDKEGNWILQDVVVMWACLCSTRRPHIAPPRNRSLTLRVEGSQPYQIADK